MLFIAGLPVFFLEIAIGQFAGVGPIKLFGRLAPALRGLGFVIFIYLVFTIKLSPIFLIQISIPFQAVVSVACLLSFFYIVVISWAIWYLVASFSLTLAWSNCENEFNTESCFSPTDEWKCLQNNSASSLCHQKSLEHVEKMCKRNPSSQLVPNGSCYDSSTDSFIMINRTTSAEEYWENYVLGHVGYSWENYVR